VVVDGCEANLNTDGQNCGTCNNKCTGGETCSGGVCGCFNASSGSQQFNATGTGKTGSLQYFTVPAGVCKLTIEAFGAQGGTGPDTRGARMKGTFSVTGGQVLTVLVGQPPANYLGGGGGSFVVNQTNQPLLVAGGGGSCFAGNCAIAETVGRIVTSGGALGGVARADAGNGGASLNSTAGAGGGLLTDGANASGGKSFLSGGLGGTGEIDGGFGGGGARGGLWGEGGGGGYSGGACANLADTWIGCGGGGSFNAGAVQDNTAGINTGAGKVLITW